MRIACPNCSAEYEVPDAMLASGPRVLKCARCGHGFQAALPAAVPRQPAPPPPRRGPEPPPAARREPSPPPPREPPAPGPPPPASRREPSPPPPREPRAPEPPPPRPAPRDREPPPPAYDPDRPPPTRGPRRHSPIDEPPPDAEEEAALSPTALALAWLASFVALGLAAWAAVHYRAEVMEAFPAATRLYRALGLG
jgi:predicted Zn finger-like uncharacterized protein